MNKMYRMSIFHSYEPRGEVPQLFRVIMQGVGPKLDRPSVTTTRSVHGSKMAHVNLVHSFRLKRTIREA